MSIFTKLEEIRERPVEERRKILFISTTIVMLFVIALWLSLLKFQSSPNNGENNTARPWEVLKKAFSFPKK